MLIIRHAVQRTNENWDASKGHLAKQEKSCNKIIYLNRRPRFREGISWAVILMLPQLIGQIAHIPVAMRLGISPSLMQTTHFSINCPHRPHASGWGIDRQCRTLWLSNSLTQNEQQAYWHSCETVMASFSIGLYKSHVSTCPSVARVAWSLIYPLRGRTVDFNKRARSMPRFATVWSNIFIHNDFNGVSQHACEKHIF